MSEANLPEVVAAAAEDAAAEPIAAGVTIESPPPALRPEASDSGDARVSLNRLAAALSQQRSTQLLLEYLRLRRIARSLT